MEFADDDDLFHKIQNNKKMRTNMREDQIWSILIQVINPSSKLIEASEPLELIKRNRFSRDLWHFTNSRYFIGTSKAPTFSAGKTVEPNWGT